MKVRVDDVDLYFDVAGAKRVPDGATMVERPTVVLLHGGPGFDHSIMGRHDGAAEPSGRRSSRTTTVGTAAATQAHATSGRWSSGATTSPAFCDALGIEKPVVVGSSFGGIVAISYADRHPDHPGKVVLDSTSRAARRSSAMFPVFERLGGPGRGRGGASSSGPIRPREPAPTTPRSCFPLYSRRPDAMQKMVEMMGRALFNQDVLEHFVTNVQPTLRLSPAARERSRVPTLVLSGDDDPVTPDGLLGGDRGRHRSVARALRALRRWPQHVRRAARARPARCYAEFVGS